MNENTLTAQSPKAAWRTAFRIVRWTTYAAAIVSFLLIVHKKPPPLIETNPRAAACGLVSISGGGFLCTISRKLTIAAAYVVQRTIRKAVRQAAFGDCAVSVFSFMGCPLSGLTFSR